MKAFNTPGWRQFWTGMALYAVVVLLQGFLLEPGRFPLPVMVLLGLLPMLPAVWAMLGWLEAVRNFDELQRRIQAEAGLFALGLTAIVTFSYGFLEIYTGAPNLSMFWVWPLIAMSYLLGGARARRRYA